MIEFFNEIVAWLDSGIYQFFKDAFAWVIVQVTILKIKWQIAALIFASDVATQILSNFNINEEIQTALARLPSVTLQQLYFFNVIEGINIVLNAFVSRFVLRFMGM